MGGQVTVKAEQKKERETSAQYRPRNPPDGL